MSNKTPDAVKFMFTEEESAQLVTIWCDALGRCKTPQDELTMLKELISAPISVMLQYGIDRGLGKDAQIQALNIYAAQLMVCLQAHAENVMSGAYEADSKPQGPTH